MSRLLLIDGDNLCYRAYFKFGGLSNKAGTPSGCIYGFPYILRSTLTKVKPDMVIGCFDGGRDKYRLNLLPTYKQRDPKLGFDKESFYAQKEEIINLLPHLNCWASWEKGREADDLIYWYVRKYKAMGWDITILSADKDFHQLIDEQVTVYNPSKDVNLTPKNLKHYFGYTPEECVDYLCLDGDKSDRIPGVPGMGEKTIRKFLDKYGSVSEYFRANTNEYPKLTKGLYKLNRALIDLGYFYRKNRKIIKPPTLTTQEVKVNMIVIAQISRRYDINTFVKVDFVQGFKNI